jgi:hypothetical protein
LLAAGLLDGPGNRRRNSPGPITSAVPITASPHNAMNAFDAVIMAMNPGRN